MSAKLTGKLSELNAWKQDTYMSATAIGVIFKNVFLDCNEAELAFRSAIRHDSAKADAWYNLGDTLASMKNNETNLVDAELAFIKTIELDPLSCDAMSRLGGVLWRQCRYDESLSVYGKATEAEAERDINARIDKIDANAINQLLSDKR